MVVCPYFSSNKLTGTVPTQFGMWTSASSHMAVDFNSIHGTLPTEIGQLSLFLGHFDV